MLWIVLLVVGLLASLFPLAALRSRSAAAGRGYVGEAGLNRALFQEKILELEEQVAAGDLSESGLKTLKTEYQRQLLADNPRPEGVGISRRRGYWLIALGVALVPLMALSLYGYIGAPRELSLRDQLQQRALLLTRGETSDPALSRLTTEIVDNLQALTQEHPQQPLFPVLLARLHQEQGLFDLAVRYYQEALSLVPGDGALQAEYAQTLFFAEGNQVTPRVKALAELALELEPNNDTALGLLGIGEFHEGRYQNAIHYWQQALEALPPMSATRQPLLAGIARAREKLGADGESADSSLAGTVSADTAPPVSLAVDVTLDSGLDIPPQTTVFVYARSWQGSPMPLAIKRLTRADLPARVTLDESMAMNPALTLASADQVEVVARVSFAGTAVAAPGDYEGKLGPLSTAEVDSPLSLVIDRKIP